MKKFLLIVCLMFIMSVSSCKTSKGSLIYYKAEFPRELQDDIRNYISMRNFDKKKAFIIVSWVSFYGGHATYISESRAKPENYDNYPLLWSTVDDALIFVYDSTYNGILRDSAAIKNEINTAINYYDVELVNRNYIVEDNMVLRFITRDNTHTIDTSRFNLKLCDKCYDKQ